MNMELVIEKRETKAEEMQRLKAFLGESTLGRMTHFCAQQNQFPPKQLDAILGKFLTIWPDWESFGHGDTYFLVMDLIARPAKSTAA